MPAPLFLHIFRDNPEDDIRGKGIRNREKENCARNGCREG